jgi:hypothetical protein
MKTFLQYNNQRPFTSNSNLRISNPIRADQYPMMPDRYKQDPYPMMQDDRKQDQYPMLPRMDVPQQQRPQGVFNQPQQSPYGTADDPRPMMPRMDVPQQGPYGTRNQPDQTPMKAPMNVPQQERRRGIFDPENTQYSMMKKY